MLRLVRDVGVRLPYENDLVLSYDAAIGHAGVWERPSMPERTDPTREQVRRDVHVRDDPKQVSI